MQFNQWLHSEMIRAGLTQAALARESGLHENTVYAYVSGKQLPSLRNLRFLCDALAWMLVDGQGCSRAEKQMLSDTLMFDAIKTV